ncbi:MAG: type I restriction enzyme R subunit, partial [Oleiphilaceae bacterium]
MTQQIANFKEESSSKIPALTLLSNLGYQFIPPDECEGLRGSSFSSNSLSDKKSTGKVVLLPVMRAFLAKQS